MRVRHSKPSTIETEGESDVNWKCASCGAENENFRQFCDGCGDPRPGTKLPSSGGISMDELLSPKDSFDQEESHDNTAETESVEIENLDTGHEEPENETSDTFEDMRAVQAEPKQPPASKDEPVKTTPRKSGRKTAPETVSTGTFKASKQKFDDNESLQSQTTPEPISGQRFSIVFVNSPASSIMKSRVSLEFDDFPTITIGRSPENVVVVPDQEVSRKHAQLSLEGTRVILKDLSSSNGTFLYNGKEFARVSDSVEVKPNSIIKFGTGTIVRLVAE